MYFSTFQELAYFLGGGRASIFFISCVVIVTFALYPAYYFCKTQTRFINVEELIGKLLWQNYWRILTIINVEPPIGYDPGSLIRGLSLFASVILIYFCYSYRFKQFKVRSQLLTVN